jgi:hypothetical protein
MFEAKTGLFHNKFLDVLWFLNIYYYELSTNPTLLLYSPTRPRKYVFLPGSKIQK